MASPFSTITLVDVQISKRNRFDPSTIHTDIAFVTSVPIYFCSMQSFPGTNLFLASSSPNQNPFFVVFFFPNVQRDVHQYQYFKNNLHFLFHHQIFFFFFSFVSISIQMHHPIQMKPADSENRNGEFLILYFVFWYNISICIRISIISLSLFCQLFFLFWLNVYFLYCVFCMPLHLVMVAIEIIAVVAYSFRWQLIKVPHLENYETFQYNNALFEIQWLHILASCFEFFFISWYNWHVEKLKVFTIFHCRLTSFTFYFWWRWVLDQKIKCITACLLLAICRIFFGSIFFRKDFLRFYFIYVSFHTLYLFDGCSGDRNMQSHSIDKLRCVPVSPLAHLCKLTDTNITNSYEAYDYRFILTVWQYFRLEFTMLAVMIVPVCSHRCASGKIDMVYVDILYLYIVWLETCRLHFWVLCLKFLFILLTFDIAFSWMRTNRNSQKFQRYSFYIAKSTYSCCRIKCITIGCHVRLKRRKQKKNAKRIRSNAWHFSYVSKYYIIIHISFNFLPFFIVTSNKG